MSGQEEFRVLAESVARELGELRHETWAAEEVTYGRRGFNLNGPGRASLHLTGPYADNRVAVESSYPAGTGGGRFFHIGVSASRGALVIAREANRRIIAAGYADELLAALERKRVQDEHTAERAALLGKAAALFGLELDGRDGDLDLSALLRLSGKVSTGGGYGEQPWTLSLELNGLEPATALAMLAVLAAAPEVQARCCRKFGPGHDQRLSLLGCERAGERAGEPSYAEAEALFSLYRHSGAGDWREWLGDAEVHPSWR